MITLYGMFVLYVVMVIMLKVPDASGQISRKHDNCLSHSDERGLNFITDDGI